LGREAGSEISIKYLVLSIMGNKEIKISVIVLTKNEEEVIVDCLESVMWADEILIVDDHSTDRTIELAERFGIKKIIIAPVASTFSDRRNLGAKSAGGEWLLYVDADERVTERLKNEIISVISNFKFQISNCVAYAIPRENIRLTKPLHYGGWWPDYVLRLMKKDKLIKWVGDLHEQPKISGDVGKLESPFIHFSHRGSLEHKVATTNKWSNIEADKMFNANHPKMNISRFISAIGREFYKRFFVYQGFRDGLEGLLEIRYQIFSIFISYAKLWEIQLKQNNKNK